MEEKKRDNQKHQRRVHYSGKYPRRFEEKYKELNPEHYSEEIQHVIAKGNTPAGMHEYSALLEPVNILGRATRYDVWSHLI